MAKAKDVRVRVILECTSCVRKSINKESSGISRYTSQMNHYNTPSELELKIFRNNLLIALPWQPRFYTWKLIFRSEQNRSIQNGIDIELGF